MHWFNANGSLAFAIHPDHPGSDIDVVCTPVGELATAVFVPPAEFVMDA